MKKNRSPFVKIFLIFSGICFSWVPMLAQHSLQVDDGNGHYTIIQGPTTGTPVQTYSLPSGGGTILTSNSGGTIPSGAYLAFPDNGSHSGFTYTGFSSQVGYDVWATQATMPTARFGAASAVVSSKLYVLGGSNNVIQFASNEVYDPSTNSWATLANMPTARQNPAAASFSNKIYCIGGYLNPNYLTTNEEYDPTTNTWAVKAAMPTARTGLAIAGAGGKLYAIGGNLFGGYMQTNEEYTPPPGNSWVAKANMPTGRDGFVAGTIGSKIYCIGGSILGSNLTTNEEYDPTLNSWATRASLPVGTSRACGAVYNGSLYFFTGLINNLGTHVADTRVYTPPPTDSWGTRASIPNMRGSAVAGNIGNFIYVVGGYLNNGAIVYNLNDQYSPTGIPFFWFTKN